jgi:hypothetical protein
MRPDRGERNLKGAMPDSKSVHVSQRTLRSTLGCFPLPGTSPARASLRLRRVPAGRRPGGEWAAAGGDGKKGPKHPSLGCEVSGPRFEIRARAAQGALRQAPFGIRTGPGPAPAPPPVPAPLPAPYAFIPAHHWPDHRQTSVFNILLFLILL